MTYKITMKFFAPSYGLKNLITQQEATKSALEVLFTYVIMDVVSFLSHAT